jgi:hypothetical protein
LFEAIETELQRWEVRQTFYRQFGGNIYFEGLKTEDSLEEVKLPRQIQNPEAHFRRALRTKLDFDFESADELLDNLPSQLNPRFGTGLDLLFDFLEIVYDHVASIKYNPKTKKPVFNKREGQKILRDAINPDLALYKTPYTMLANGQIVAISHKPVQDMVEQVLLIEASGGITEATLAPLQAAATNYLSRGATEDQKKQAVRDLADALESLRPSVKEELLSEDERELFKIANQFAIRHNDNKQKGNYDKSIWFDWMFQVNLAALLTVIRILQSNRE